MGDLLNPIWAPLIGLLVLAAVVAVMLRLAVDGPSRMRRALVTVGGTLVAVGLIGVLAQSCSAPNDPADGGSVSGR